jgi:hypothetical protein
MSSIPGRIVDYVIQRVGSARTHGRFRGTNVQPGRGYRTADHARYVASMVGSAESVAITQRTFTRASEDERFTVWYRSI